MSFSFDSESLLRPLQNIGILDLLVYVLHRYSDNSFFEKLPDEAVFNKFTGKGWNRGRRFGVSTRPYLPDATSPTLERLHTISFYLTAFVSLVAVRSAPVEAFAQGTVLALQRFLYRAQHDLYK